MSLSRQIFTKQTGSIALVGGILLLLAGFLEIGPFSLPPAGIQGTVLILFGGVAWLIDDRRR